MYLDRSAAVIMDHHQTQREMQNDSHPVALHLHDGDDGDGGSEKDEHFTNCFNLPLCLFLFYLPAVKQSEKVRLF